MSFERARVDISNLREVVEVNGLIQVGSQPRERTGERAGKAVDVSDPAAIVFRKSFRLAMASMSPTLALSIILSGNEQGVATRIAEIGAFRDAGRALGPPVPGTSMSSLHLCSLGALAT